MKSLSLDILLFEKLIKNLYSVGINLSMEVYNGNLSMEEYNGNLCHYLHNAQLSHKAFIYVFLL